VKKEPDNKETEGEECSPWECGFPRKQFISKIVSTTELGTVWHLSYRFGYKSMCCWVINKQSGWRQNKGGGDQLVCENDHGIVAISLH